MKRINVSKTSVIRAILIALIISVMIIIFALSAQDSADSGNASGGFTEALLALFGMSREEMGEEAFLAAESFIRSAAHFSEYALLAFLAMLLLATYKLGGARSLVLSVAFAAVYAVTDEIHQIFVPGRAAQISDWLVDTGGALCGALVALALILIVSASKNRKTKPQKDKKRNKKRFGKKKNKK